MRRLIIGALLCLLALSAAPAIAQPPGTNGQILFARDGDIDEGGIVYSVNPDGSHEHAVFPLGVECPHWSPDGTHIATCGLPPDGAAVIVDPDDGSYRTLAMPDPANLFTPCPVWSADGARLACGGEGQSDPDLNGIYTIRSSDGGDLTRVTANPGGLDEAGAYSPNGKRLVFARFSDLTSESSGLYVVRLSDGALRAIAPAGSSLSSSGDWSTQGNQIVYSRRLGEDVRSAIWIVHANGSGLHRLVVDGLGCGGAFSDPSAASCLDPHWSPDGTKLVFQGITPESGSNIYTVNADGTGLRQLTHSGSDNFPDWGVHPLA